MGIPAPDLAVRRAAARYVEQHDVTPPVNARDLLETAEGATVSREAWPHEVDAILIGFERSPRVFLRATENLSRERFTLAHELGHLVLPWHIPQPTCHSEDGEPEDKSANRSGEQEADLFASCILAPDRWLRETTQIHGLDMTSILEEMNILEMTTIAALRALRRSLLPGWAFSSYGGSRVVVTPGTAVPHSLQGPLAVLNYLHKESVESGAANLNDFDVEWFRLHELREPPSAKCDPRSTTGILRDALAVVSEDAEEQAHLVNVANGVIGAMWNKSHGKGPADLFSALRYRAAEHSELSLMLDVPDFDLWLGRKIEERQSVGKAPK